MKKQPELPAIPKKRGRPTIGKKPMTNSQRAAKSRKKSKRIRLEIMLEPWQMEGLEKFAEQTRLSKAEIARVCIECGCNTWIKDKIKYYIEVGTN